ncbi:MAG: lytic transglycosylase domain-containing protein, partial [Acidisphaera sp.]|nr:lytic transglycosylase domain-containing protein [Acidisphaera sp.]
TGAQAFVELIGKISSMPNPTLQQRNALILLGGAANELWPVITGGTRAFQENIKEAQRFGVMNTEGAKQAKALKRDYDQLSLAVQGLGFAVAEKAGPRMGQFLDMLTGIVVGLRQAMGASDDLKRKMDAYENVHPAVKLPLTTRIDDYIRQHPLNGLPLNPVGGDDTGGFVPFAPDHPVAPWGGRIGAHPALPAPTRVPGQLAPDIEHEVVMQALRQGIDPNRAVALFRTEAGGYNRVSPAGAFGPAQLMPGTARELGVADDPNAPGYDWRQNVAAGVRYFAQQYQRFGNYDAAEAAYNAGPGGRGVGRFAATGDPSDLPNETQRYVSTIDRLTLGARTAALSLDSGATGGGQGAPGPSGKAELIVTVQGETRGVRTTTRATGDIWDGAPRVQRTMPQTAGTG